jgi:hypothetical protein
VAAAEVTGEAPGKPHENVAPTGIIGQGNRFALDRGQGKVWSFMTNTDRGFNFVHQSMLTDNR